MFGNAIAALSGEGGSDPGVDDPSAFLINTDFNYPDVDALRAALANADIFDPDNSSDPSAFELGDMDEHGALKIPLSGSSERAAWLRTPTSNAVWIGWDMRAPATLLQAHENAGGNYVDSTPNISLFGLYENPNVEDQGLDDIAFTIHGDPAVVSFVFNLYSYFSNYDGTGTVIATIPLDVFRDLSKHSFAVLVENFYDSDAMVSGIHIRLWHKGAPTGATWTLLSELSLTKDDVSPDAFEAWRFLTTEARISNVHASDPTSDFLHVGNVKMADAQINFDPFGVGVTADPAVLSAAEGSSVNEVVLAVCADATVNGNNAGAGSDVHPIVVVSAMNALGLNLALHGWDLSQVGWSVGATLEGTNLDCIAITSISGGLALLGVKNGNGTITKIGRTDVSLAFTVENVTAHLVEDFSTWSSLDDYATRWARAITQAIDGELSGADHVEGHQTLNTTEDAFALLIVGYPEPIGTDDLWTRFRIQGDPAIAANTDNIGTMANASVLVGSGDMRYALALYGPGSGSGLFVRHTNNNAQLADYSGVVTEADIFDNAPHNLITRQRANMDGSVTIDSWFDTTHLGQVTTPTDLVGHGNMLGAFIGAGASVRTPDIALKIRIISLDVWDQNVTPNPLGLL